MRSSRGARRWGGRGAQAKALMDDDEDEEEKDCRRIASTIKSMQSA